VLVRELKGLGLDVELLKRSESGEYVLASEVKAAEEAKRNAAGDSESLEK
jgi:hypothetical protein